VQLTNDENNALESMLYGMKDQFDHYPVIQFLTSIGLPPQTLGLRGQKAGANKFLSNDQLKRCQRIIISLRRELDL
jgi:hypothetical protein